MNQGVIKRIIEVINDKNKWCVEFGAWDGIYCTNCRNLITDEGWSGILIESDNKKYRKLVDNYRGNNAVICINKTVNFEGPDRFDLILSKTPVPKNFDLLSIDIDGNDYHIWNSVGLYKPKIVVIEFNQSIPIDIEFVQPRDMNINQGSSLLAIVNLGKKKGYELIATTDFDAFFVDNKYFGLFGIKDNSLSAIHKEQKYYTRLFQLFDGTLVLSGCEDLFWHGIKINREKIQTLPKFLRAYPTKLSSFQRLIFNYGWRGSFIYVFKAVIRSFNSFARRLKKIIRHNTLCNKMLIHAHEEKSLQKWKKDGMPDQLPHELKQMVIKDYARKYGIKIFVETGTFLGQTVDAVKYAFNKIFSIELDDKLYNNAKTKFLKFKNISIIRGDSAEVLPGILNDISEPCLFWLDGHYSHGITAKAKIDTPILQELSHILSHPVKEHIILIDDAHFFNSQGDWPDIKKLEEMVHKERPDLIFEIKNDIIRIHKS
jgi:hypothetical protein